MSRANPFGDLDDFGSDHAAKPVPAETIDKIAQSSGFPSRKAAAAAPHETASQTGETAPPSPAPSPVPPAARQPRRHVTGRNRQINIKATEETITELYRIADAMNLPLGAVLEQALAALATQRNE
ncbi:stability/partitioning determinant [Sphingobium limneticum]|uniref:Stability/partitioning determinant n=1 Tax=Sphingobium limneticum TaxID=1007511 RepID=A0A5J5HS18_9SPHN|nr:stability/partitioning determinant [Sphingobium limneticum]KAA9011204.1 stability/partitioning determinant [Sphingobium limneticum]KAA9022842.1 stability/partitioning determinant [Sphingobium limneticum]